MDSEIFNEFISDDGSSHLGHNVIIHSANDQESSGSPFCNQILRHNKLVKRYNNDVYKEKYKRIKRAVKDCIFENAALCDEVARLQEKVIIAKEERKYLLKKVQSFHSCRDGSAQTNPVFTLSAAGLGKIGGEILEPPVKKRPPAKKRPAPKSTDEAAKPKPKKKKVPLPRKLITPIPLDSSDRPIYPISLGSLTIHSLGVIVFDRPGYHTETCIYPVGFCSSRSYASLKNPTTQCLYQCMVQDTAFGPHFEVVPEDDPGHTFVGTTPDEVHTALLSAINTVCGKQVVSTEGEGSKFFGLSHPTVQNLIQSCTGARRCTDYKWIHFEVAKPSEEENVTKDFDPRVNFDVLLHMVKDIMNP